MISATTLNTTTTTTNGNVEQPPFPAGSNSHFCNCCKTSFQNGLEHRTHMKTPWQYVQSRNRDPTNPSLKKLTPSSVYNLKRRIASLPPITYDVFTAQVEQKLVENTSASTMAKTRVRNSGTNLSDSEPSNDEASDNDLSSSPSPYQCLFCTHTHPSPTSTSNPTTLTETLTHMSTTHNFHLPSPANLTDLPTFLTYLATRIHTWHECLYCGCAKSFTQSVQGHMRDKGHCRLDFEREPELWGFWEGLVGGGKNDEGEGGKVVGRSEQGGFLSALDDVEEEDGEELCLASGKVITSRHAAPAAKIADRRRRLAASALPPALTNPPPGDAEDAEDLSPLAIAELQSASRHQSAPGQQISRREVEMSLTGVSQQQRRALVLAEKKAQRSEAGARRAREWSDGRGVRREWDQVDNQGKWGKQNHKLLPR